MDAIEINPSENSEAEEGIVSSVEICRVCLLDNLAMRDLFHEDELASLSVKTMSFANVKMLPGDGLPGQVCCMCAEKLESAYEFKLQVEHADTVLRERFLSLNMKEELFFNEVEVHLESEQHEQAEEMSMDTEHYDAVTASLAGTSSRDDDCAIKESSITLLPLCKDDELQQQVAEQENEPTSSTKIECMADVGALNFLQSNADQQVVEHLDMQSIMEGNQQESGITETVAMSINDSLKRESEAKIDTIGPEEHDYILHETSVMSSTTEIGVTGSESHLVTIQSEIQDNCSSDTHLYDKDKNSLSKLGDESVEEKNDIDKDEKSQSTDDNKIPHEQETSQIEMRRSKRNLTRKGAADENTSVEENYFENLNLSSRLKKVQSDQADNNGRVFFACYLCDKQFLTKDLLKEHLHSHEEVRKTLLLKNTPEKIQKCTSESPEKMPPSGRKANKCPYCGKEYLYIISFNKHLKQHEREKEEDGKDTMPLELSLQEADQNFDIEEDYNTRRKLVGDCRKRRRRYQSQIQEESNIKREEINERVGRANQNAKGKKLCENIDGNEADDADENDVILNRAAMASKESTSKTAERGKQWRKRCRTSTFQCDKCSDTFSNKRDFRKHALTHINLKCSVCDEEFDSLEKLRNHRTKHVLEGVLSEQDLEESARLSKSDMFVQENTKDEGEGGVEGMIVAEAGAEVAEEEDEEEEEHGPEERAEEEDDEGQVGGIDASPSAYECATDDNEDSDYIGDFNANGNLENTLERKRKGEFHLELDYNCKFCDERFRRKDLLQRHMDQQHPQVKAYKCTECNKSFGNELTLRNHLIATNHKTFVHGQEYDPNKRIKRVAARAAQRIIDKIKTEDGLEELEEDEDNEGGLGNELERSMTSMYGRRREGTTQRRTYSRRDLECATCSKRCGSKQALSKHMEQHAREEKCEKLERSKKSNVDRKEIGVQKTGRRSVSAGSKDGEIERGSATGSQVRLPGSGNGAGSCSGGGSCGTIGTLADGDDDDSDFESGLDWPMDNHECATCKKRYSTKKSLLRHQLLHEEPNFECDICNVKFYRKDKLKAHYDKCSEKNPDQVRKCNICGDSFENNEMLREHRAKHVTEGILTEEDLRDIEPRPEEKRHGERVGRKRRTDIVGLECTECNKQYTSRKGLLRHIQVHEGKKYLCDICPKKFYRREHLKIHVAKHNMIKPYKCNRCTKRFIKEEQLTNHLSKHDRTFKKNKETDSTKRFLCEICSKSFTQSTTLIAHLRAHNGIKPYVCEVCSRPFTTNAYLKMHMRTHTQERPYICQYCSRAFARADTLANHLTSHTGEAKYHCKYCPKNFRRLKSLKEHVFIHTGQRPYACPTCDRRFNNNGSRYAHSKRCKQNFTQNQTRGQNLGSSVPLQTINQHQNPNQQRLQQATTIATGQIVKTQNIKTIAITRQPDTLGTQEVLQHQEILMPLIFEILPEGTKIFTTT